jgi:hypothetical protein
MQLKPRVLRTLAAFALAIAPLSSFGQTPAAAAPSSASTVTGDTETSGVKFDNDIVLRGNKLLLSGAGTRYKFVVKVYAAGLYAPVRLTTPEAAWDTKTPRLFKVVMLREIDADDLGKLFTRGIEKNTTREEFGKVIPGVIKLADIFSARKKLAAGDGFAIEWTPGLGTTVTVNGQPVGAVIEGPEFFSALMKIWFGSSPADQQLKDALLGGAKAG